MLIIAIGVKDLKHVQTIEPDYPKIDAWISRLEKANEVKMEKLKEEAMGKLKELGIHTLSYSIAVL